MTLKLHSFCRAMAFLTLLLCISCPGYSQPRVVTLHECYSKAEINHPLTKQRVLLEQSRLLTVENASRGRLPVVGIHGQGSYQSDVTRVPIDVPGIDIPVVPKDQYRLYAELNQPLTDLITVSRQRELEQATAATREQSLEVELYAVRERVNELYFSVLLADAHLAQNALLKKDIETAIARLRTAMEYGTELQSNLDKLKAELLRAGQREIELLSNRKSYVAMLSLLIGEDLPSDCEFTRPMEPNPPEQLARRPEFTLFESQKMSISLQQRLYNTRRLPKFSAFLQTGFGQPSPVNMLDDDFKSYYIAGLRLSWPLSFFYTSSNENQLFAINGSLVDSRREAFELSTNLAIRRQQAEIEKLIALIKTDDEIITLRTSVKNTASLQLENGIVSVNDFLREVNAEDLARQGRILHEVQLLMAQYTLAHIAGH